MRTGFWWGNLKERVSQDIGAGRWVTEKWVSLK